MWHPRWCVLALIFAVYGCGSDAQPAKEPVRRGTSEAADKLVRSVIAKQFNVDPLAIAMDQPISAPPLKADDLDLVEIIMELEERQEIEISDAAVERYTGGKLGAGPPGITPNQLVAIVREASPPQIPKRKK